MCVCVCVCLLFEEYNDLTMVNLRLIILLISLQNKSVRYIISLRVMDKRNFHRSSIPQACLSLRDLIIIFMYYCDGPNYRSTQR